MRFDRALGNVQIASNFRVVASLEQQMNDLPFPGSHLAELLFHNHLHLTDAPQTPQLARKPGPFDTSGFGSLRLILHSRGQIAVRGINLV
jgi:hypothetical protein